MWTDPTHRPITVSSSVMYAYIYIYIYGQPSCNKILLIEFDECSFISPSFICPHEMCNETPLRGRHLCKIVWFSLTRARVGGDHYSPVSVVLCTTFYVLSIAYSHCAHPHPLTGYSILSHKANTDDLKQGHAGFPTAKDPTEWDPGQIATASAWTVALTLVRSLVDRRPSGQP